MNKLIFALAVAQVATTAQADYSIHGIHRTQAVNISDNIVKTRGMDGTPTLTKVCVDGYAYLVLNVGGEHRASGTIIQMREQSSKGGRLVTCELNEKDELRFIYSLN